MTAAEYRELIRRLEIIHGEILEETGLGDQHWTASECRDLMGRLDVIHDRLFVEMDREELHAAASGYRELIRRLDVLHGEMLADIEISDPRVELVYRLADIMTPLRNFVPGGASPSPSKEEP